MRVLIADDDRVFRTLLDRQLSEWGYEVELANDGARALAALQNEAGPSLAILDWDMPGLDGVEICRRIRAAEAGRYIYLLLVTGNDTPDGLLAGMDAGADDYLTKPVDLTQLRLRLRASCRILEFDARLRSQAAELARSNAELEQFAYIASHDLQEPLRMVASFTQLLGKRYSGKLDETADRYIDFAVDGAKRMQQLIADLLALSRVGTRGGRFERIKLANVVSEVLVNLEPAIRDSGAAITSDEMPCVVADPVQMGQMLQNLIGNAIKFRGTRPPKVHLSAAETEREWLISVQDNGIGIAPHSSERVFQIFQRLHSREQYPGTGIGLAVCKKIAQRHGGRIWFDPTPGGGTTFHFTIPRTYESVAATEQ